MAQSAFGLTSSQRFCSSAGLDSSHQACLRISIDRDVDEGHPCRFRFRPDDVFDLLLLQCWLEDLTHAREGKLIRNPHPLWNGCAFGNVSGREIEQLLLSYRNAGLRLNVGHGDLSRVGIGAADRSHHGDRGMFEQSLFDQLRIDVVSTPDDELLAPAREPEISVRILATEVTRVQPVLAATDPYCGVDQDSRRTRWAP